MKYSFKYLDVSLEVNVRNNEIISFLKAYFIPYFSIVSGSSRNAFVQIFVDINPKYKEPTSVNRDEILVDGSKGFLATTGSIINEHPAREVLLFPTKALVFIDRSSKTIRITGSTADSLKIPVLRIIEDVTQIEVEKAGGVFVHSSGIVIGNHAVIAVGDKHAGKTSFLTNSLNSFDCKKLNNDNAVLFLKNNSVFVRGWPSFFKVELGTMAYNRQFANFFPKAKREVLKNPSLLWDHSLDKVPLYPRQAANLFKRNIIAQAKLKSIVMPVFSRNNIQYKKINPQLNEIKRTITENLQGKFNKKHPNWHHYNDVSEKLIRTSVDKISKVLLKQASFHAINWSPSYTQLMTEIENMADYYEDFRVVKSGFSATGITKWPSLPSSIS